MSWIYYAMNSHELDMNLAQIWHELDMNLAQTWHELGMIPHDLDMISYDLEMNLTWSHMILTWTWHKLDMNLAWSHMNLAWTLHELHIKFSWHYLSIISNEILERTLQDLDKIFSKNLPRSYQEPVGTCTIIKVLAQDTDVLPRSYIRKVFPRSYRILQDLQRSFKNLTRCSTWESVNNYNIVNTTT
jgi:hypothetical protein